MAGQPFFVLILSVAVCTISSAAATCTDPFKGCQEEKLEYTRYNLGPLCATPQYSGIASSLPWFTAEPADSTQSNNTHLQHEVVLQCSYTADNTYNGTITWEHNGLVIYGSSVSVDLSFPTDSSSQLSIRPPFAINQTSLGEYQCRVNYGNYTIASRVAKVALAYTDGWLDQIYTQPVLGGTGENLQLQTPVGGSVILECQPNTTETVAPSKIWLYKVHDSFQRFTSDPLRMILPDGSLLVRNFNLPDDIAKAEYKCTVPFVNYEVQRTFTISDGPLSPVLPKDSTVAVGTNLSLYCLINNINSSNSQPSLVSEITWLKDGQPIPATNGEEVADWSHFHPMGEVLVLENITMEMGGVYSCLPKYGKAYSARLTVIAPPVSASITISGQDSYTYNGNLYTPVEHQDNASLALHCTVDPSNATETLNYKWKFRGSAVDSFDSLFNVDDNVLRITASDLWNVIGSYQCTAASIAGSVTTSVQLLARDKPTPPSNIRVVQVEVATRSYKYLLRWDAPVTQLTNDSSTTYKIVIDVFRIRMYHKRYTSNVTFVQDPYWLFWGNNFADDEYRFVFRVAASSRDGVWSDLAPFKMCPDPFIVERAAPPLPNKLLHNLVPDNEAHRFSATLNWSFEECSYPHNLLTVIVELNCSRMEPQTFYRQSSSVAGEYSVGPLIPCCSVCSFAITLRHDIVHTLASRSEDHEFTTSALSPSVPAVLNAVGRPSKSNGKTVNIIFTLPPVNASCKPSDVSVRYTNETFARDITKPLTSYSPDEQTYSITLELEEGGLCWEQYNISMAYRNSANQSGFSNVMSLDGPSAGSVNGFNNFNAIATKPTVVEVRWEHDEGAECLLLRNLAEGNVCFIQRTNRTCPSIISENCHVVGPDDAVLEFSTGISPYTEYCFNAALVMSNDSTADGTSRTLVSKNVSVRSPEASPDTPPTDFNVSIVQNSSILQIYWSPPLQKDRNGILTHYNLSISHGTGVANVTTVPAAGLDTYEEKSGYDSSLDYRVSVSACTSAGCGPSATQTIQAEASSEGTQAPSQDDVKLIIGVAIAATVIGTLVIVVVLLVCGKKAIAKWKKKKYDMRPECFDDDENEVSSNAPVSFRVCGSVYSDASTEISPLMQSYLKDAEEEYLARKNPEGSADDSMEEDFPEVEHHGHHEVEVLDSESKSWSGVIRLNGSPPSSARRSDPTRDGLLKGEERLELENVRHNGYVLEHREMQSNGDRTQFSDNLRSSTKGEELSKLVQSKQQTAQPQNVPPVTGYLSEHQANSTGALILTSATIDTSKTSFDIFEDNFVSQLESDSHTIIRNAVTTVPVPASGYCTEQHAITHSIPPKSKTATFPTLPPPPASAITGVTTVNEKAPPLSGYCTEGAFSSMLLAAAPVPGTLHAKSTLATLSCIHSSPSFKLTTTAPNTQASTSTQVSTGYVASNGATDNTMSNASSKLAKKPPNAQESTSYVASTNTTSFKVTTKPPANTSYVALNGATDHNTMRAPSSSGLEHAISNPSKPKESTPEFDLIGELVEDCSDLSDSETSSVFATEPHQSISDSLKSISDPLTSISDPLRRTRSAMTSGIYSASSESPEPNTSSTTPADSRSNSVLSSCHGPASCFDRKGSEGYHSIGGSDVFQTFSSQEKSQSVCSGSGYVSNSPDHSSVRVDSSLDSRSLTEHDGLEFQLLDDDSNYHSLSSGSELGQSKSASSSHLQLPDSGSEIDVCSTTVTDSQLTPPVNSVLPSVPAPPNLYSCIPSLLPHNNNAATSKQDEPLQTTRHKSLQCTPSGGLDQRLDTNVSPAVASMSPSLKPLQNISFDFPGSEKKAYVEDPPVVFDFPVTAS